VLLNANTGASECAHEEEEEEEEEEEDLFTINR